MWWIWKLVIFFLAVFLLPVALALLANLLGLKKIRDPQTGKVQIRVGAFLAAPVVLGVSLFMVGYIDYRPLASLGLHFYPSWWKELSLGIVMGGMMVPIMTAVFWALTQKNPFQQATFKGFVKSPARFFGIFLGALNEELIGRGYPLQTLIGGIGLYPAIAVTSAFFGLLHYQRVRWLGFVEASLAGLLLAIAVLETKALWLAVGIHLGWNFLEAVFRMRHEDVQPTQLHFRYFAAYIVVLLFMLMLILMPIGSHPEVEKLWEEYIQSAR